MRKLNILSIDFDYFQNVSENTVRNCYPDGLDLPSDISTIIWGVKYGNNDISKKIHEVTVKKSELNELKNLIYSKSRLSTKFIANNSHSHIYKYIVSIMNAGSYDKLEIVNIDMHHDFVNNNDEVDCGNWLGQVYKKYRNNCKITWIANDISKDLYEFTDEEFKIVQVNFDKIKELDKIDLIYLCRSNSWLPPHLDKYFDSFMRDMLAVFYNTAIEKDIREPRKVIEIS